MTGLMDEMYRWNDMKEMKYKLQLRHLVLTNISKNT